VVPSLLLPALGSPLELPPVLLPLVVDGPPLLLLPPPSLPVDAPVGPVSSPPSLLAALALAVPSPCDAASELVVTAVVVPDEPPVSTASSTVPPHAVATTSSAKPHAAGRIAIRART
jgi:hypothetical protein